MRPLWPSFQLLPTISFYCQNDAFGRLGGVVRHRVRALSPMSVWVQIITTNYIGIYTFVFHDGNVGHKYAVLGVFF